MRLVVQRVKSASVTVEGNIISSIGPGILALVGIHENDTTDDLEYCCKRLLGCKLWDNDSGGQWRHGVKQRGLEVLCVSQFTLYGTLSKKNQPDYKRAMKAIPAQVLYNQFLDMLQVGYETEKIKDGAFGAMMDVALVNDGPVTILIESTVPQSSSATTEGVDNDVDQQGTQTL
jgi:D-aminoacyl-tRNA deacylase